MDLHYEVMQILTSMVIMKKVSVAELKAKLSEYLAYARHGEEIIVTDHGKPIARLAPLPDTAGFDAHIAELIRTGKARAPKQKLDVEQFLSRPRVQAPPGYSLSDEVIAEREESRW